MQENNSYFKNKALQRIVENSNIIIFDVNGLIIDDEAMQLEAANLALSEFDNKKEITEEYWKKFCVGHKADSYFYKILFDNDNDNNDYAVKIDNKNEIINKLIDRKNMYYKNILNKKILDIVRPGVLDFIGYLKKRKEKYDLKTAIATSAVKEELYSIIGSNGLNIEDYFDIIITGSDIKKSKPNPDIYNKVLKIAGPHFRKGLVFEDSKTGVESATRAGLPVIVIPNKFTKDQNFDGAIYVISDLTSYAKIIKNNTPEKFETKN